MKNLSMSIMAVFALSACSLASNSGSDKVLGTESHPVVKIKEKSEAAAILSGGGFIIPSQCYKEDADADCIRNYQRDLERALRDFDPRALPPECKNPGAPKGCFDYGLEGPLIYPLPDNN